jgi:hypothetical protein
MMGFDSYLFAAFVFAVAAPIVLILTRRELNNVRSSVIDDLKLTVFRNNADLPQLDLAAARYRSQTSPQGLGSRQDLFQIGSGALAFVLMSWCGFALLFTPIDWLVSDGPRFPSVVASVLWGDFSPVCPALGKTTCRLANTATIAGFAFLGSYVVQIQYLMRATLNQELGAMPFVRSALEMLIGIIVSITLFRAAGTLMGDMPAESTAKAGFSCAAIAVAFVIGYQPDLGLSRLMKWASAWTKGVDEIALKNSKIVPLEVIDGIDRAISLRLQESNLYDIQALATVNPVALFAETPYNLYECFDWVLQAQLCLVVGTMGFTELKKHGVRTIFDLERAVLAQGAPDSYVSGIAGVILANASDPFKAKVNLSGNNPAGVSTDIARHLVAIMGDDLHVHRLRALWNTILHTTAGTPDGEPHWLFRTGPLPGEAQDDPMDDTARAAIDLVDSLGRTNRAARNESPIDPSKVAELDAQCLSAAKFAVSLGDDIKERVRMLWNPNYARKNSNENSLEQFFENAEFKDLLS